MRCTAAQSADRIFLTSCSHTNLSWRFLPNSPTTKRHCVHAALSSRTHEIHRNHTTIKGFRFHHRPFCSSLVPMASFGSSRHGQEAGDDNYVELASLAAVQPRSADWRRTLTRREAREVYDKHGRKDMVKDSESVYGGPATDALLRGTECLSTAKVLFEFGHGSGRLALRLLQSELPEDCSYIGVDQSPVMHEMAKQRLSMFSDRADLLLSPDGDPSTAIAGSRSVQDETVDVFVSTYVLDLLSEDDVAEVLRLAGRILRPGGQLCLTGLTYGTRVGPLASVATLVWEAVHLLAPKVVGGCRAQRLEGYLGPLWEVKSSTVVSGGFVSSEVLICSKREVTRITSKQC